MTPTTCVIYNPAAGRGKARKLFEAAQRRFGSAAVFRTTSGSGEAIDLARKAALEGFERVVAAGGDGTVHEVANGLLLSGNREVIFSVLPVGSSNDYAYALGLGRWWSDSLEPWIALADVGVVRWGDRERYFVNGVGIGFNGMVTLESFGIRFLRGMPLYALAFLRSMARHFNRPKLTVRLDEKEECRPTLALSISLGIREGGFPLFPAARLDDGWFDTLQVGRVKRWELVRYLPNMILGKVPTNHPEIRAAKCTQAWVRSEHSLCVHADGELICLPHDGIRELAIELLPGRLRVERSVSQAFGPPEGSDGPSRVSNRRD